MQLRNQRHAWASREQDTSKAKENLNNLDTKALGREVRSACASGYVTVPAIAMGGVLAAILVRTINANSDEFENGCRLKRVKDTKTGVASTADSVSMFTKKCWSRRSSRGIDAGLACGHGHVKRMESADAAQRRGTVECPREKIEESVRQVDWRVLSAHRSVKQTTFHNRTVHRSQAKSCQGSSVECSDRTWRNDSEAGVDRPPWLFEFGDENVVLNAEEECGDSRVWYEYFPVATRDVLSYALVSPEFF